MSSSRLFATAIRRLGPLAALIFSASLASAQTNTWTLTGVTFNDGTSVSGFVTYNFGTATVTNWSVSVQLGTNPAFTARTYDPTNSTALTLNLGNPQTTIILQESPAPGAGQRQFRITPISNLDGTSAVVAVNLATAGGGSGAIECFNCSPFRLIVSGTFVLAAAPAMNGPALLALTALLLSMGSWTLLRRRNALALPETDRR